MTIAAKDIAAALLTYDLAVGTETPMLATRVDAMRQVLEQFVANSLPPQMRIDPAAFKNAESMRRMPIVYAEALPAARPAGHLEVTPIFDAEQ